MKIGRIDIDFIRKDISQKEIDLFLGPIDDEQDQETFILNEKLVIAHFMAIAGIFPSIGQARKNGWDKPIPPGFSQFVVGKKRSMITILNITG